MINATVVKIRTPSAERQRRYTARQKDGVVVLPVLAVEIDTTEMLRDLGYIATIEPDRREIADALSRWVYQQMTRHRAAKWPV